MTTVYRLSPNEQAFLLHQKNCERRRSRLVRVREQEKAHARNLVAQSVLKQQAEKVLLDEHIHAQTEAGLKAELRNLEDKYTRTLASVGQGQKEAQYVNDERSRLQELRVLLAAKQHARARERHAAALKQCATERRAHIASKESAVQRRKFALESNRGAVCDASPSSTSPHMLVLNLAVDRGKKVRLKEVEGYSLSYYHIPDSVVERAGTEERSRVDAHQMAREVTVRDAAMEARSRVMHQEQNERSRLRHRRALEKVKLQKEKDQMLAEISGLEREDRARRQRSLARKPLDIFQPPQQRLDAIHEQQREMEQAFEGLCLQAHAGLR